MQCQSARVSEGVRRLRQALWRPISRWYKTKQAVGEKPHTGEPLADSDLCVARSSTRATAVSLGLIECLAPVGQKLGDEGMFLIWLHG